MNYKEAIDYIHGIPKFVRPLGNAKLAKLLTALDNPQNKLRFVHAAGTNGKGSVCAMTAEILSRAGYRTGLYTSPFIEVFNERIRIGHDLIEDDTLAKYVTVAADIMEREDAYVSEFAFITAVALKYFADEQCDIVVWETGMGGRLDATNIIPPPEVAVITSIGLDHAQYLGGTVDEIAKEKCGIIKHGSDVVSAPNEPVINIIKDACKKADAPLTVCDKAEHFGNKFMYKTWSYHLSLKGKYQAENAAVVLETVNALRRRGYTISAAAVCGGFENVRWAARYEFVAPNIVIDGGHNIDGIRALKRTLLAENKPVTVVLAMMKDKSYEVCIHTIAGAAESIVATELDTERSLKAAEIKRVCDAAEIKCEAEPDIEKAIAAAVEKAGKKGLVCICGSLYLAGTVKQKIKEKLGYFR